MRWEEVNVQVPKSKILRGKNNIEDWGNTTSAIRKSTIFVQAQQLCLLVDYAGDEIV